MARKALVYIADLTHTGPVISSNVHPLASGLLGAMLLRELPELVEVEVFKYPQDLSKAIERRIPNIVGFSNYSWNCNLSYEYARRIKKASPSTIIIFGGPNYGLVHDEIAWFWERYPLIDFYIVKEGEVALVDLVRALDEVNYEALRLKQNRVRLGNCHYWWEDELVEGDVLPRIRDLGELPSPYLMGLMDKFFDGTLSPMVHTTRGCPFKCTFCTEGATYYNKVAQRVELEDELRYIAQRIGKVPDLFVSDANFGMYRQDLEKARTIHLIQQEYGWPKRLVVSTGKNQKERVVNVASMLDGALNVAASLQSTDEKVLENIKRSNISIDALNTMRQETGEAEADTFTEIILGLPGDSLEAHVNTLRDVVDADMGIIRMYQLILLPQTELNTPDTRDSFQMKTKHRFMPRSFGRYALLGETFTAVESEEICVENNSLSFNDYVECRELDMTVEIIHNGGTYSELRGVCEWLGVAWFDFLMTFFRTRRSQSKSIALFYDSFRDETIEGIFETREDLDAYFRKNLDEVLDLEGSTNEMANAKVRAFFELQDEIQEVLFQQIEEIITEKGFLDPRIKRYLRELKEYCRFKKIDLTSDKEFEVNYSFDFEALQEHKFAVDPLNFVLNTPRQLSIKHTADQRKMIEGYIQQYGTSLDGLGRILMRVWPTKRLFRQLLKDEKTNSERLERMPA